MSRCVFCGIVDGSEAASTVYDGPEHLAFLDLFPWRPGHLLVIPKTHAQRVVELPETTATELFRIGTKLAGALRAAMPNCRDLHFIINDGRAANQTVPHVHLHLVPRSGGDLPRVLGHALAHLAPPLRRPASRDLLDQQAEEIRRAL